MGDMHNLVYGQPLPVVITDDALPILPRGKRKERRRKRADAAKLTLESLINNT